MSTRFSIFHSRREPASPADAALGNPACDPIRAHFSAYLDGATTGVMMATIAAHLQTCDPCSEEFESLRAIQRSLADLGPAPAPARLQSDLLHALALEHDRGTHLSLSGKIAAAWQSWLAPAVLRAAGGLTIALVLIGSFAWMFNAPAVEANDDSLAHLVAPHYLYSEVPPQPIATDRDTPIMVEALVDPQGEVYDYTILAGPTDDAVKLRVQENLLTSVFRPATLFGVPVRGHVLLTYTGVNVRG